MTSRCSSLMALRASCDLVLGLQVAHTSNELARIFHLQKGGTEDIKNHGSPMTCWCGFGGGVGRWWKSPVRIIASKLEVLGEKQTWKGTNQILQHSCFPSEFWVQRKTPVFEAKKGNLKRSIYIHSSVIVYTKLGGSIANKPTSRLVVCTFSGFPGSGWLRGMAMLLPKSLTPFTFGDRVKPLVERDGQVEEGNLG